MHPFRFNRCKFPCSISLIKTFCYYVHAVVIWLHLLIFFSLPKDRKKERQKKTTASHTKKLGSNAKIRLARGLRWLRDIGKRTPLDTCQCSQFFFFMHARMWERWAHIVDERRKCNPLRRYAYRYRRRRYSTNGPIRHSNECGRVHFFHCVAVHFWWQMPPAISNPIHSISAFSLHGQHQSEC